MRTDLVAQSFNRQNCFDRVLPGHKIFRLQLFTSAWGEAHSKVRQPLVPGAGYAQLFRTVFGGKFSNGVQIPGSSFRPEEFGGRVKRLPFFLAALDPHFVNTLVLPIGKEADTVATRFDRIEVVLYGSER